MATKRQIDRTNHRANRAESKVRLQNIEAAVDGLHNKFADMLGEIRSLRPGASHGSPSQSSPPVNMPLLPFVETDCRCGFKHKDKSECIEYFSFVPLYRSKVDVQISNQERQPRTPPLEDFLLGRSSSNQLSQCLSGALRHYKFATIQVLFGMHLLAYRLIRVSMPNPTFSLARLIIVF